MRIRHAACAMALALLAVPDADSVCTPTVQWEWYSAARYPEAPGLCTSPLVVQVTDDNGDGRVDTSDIPDVVPTGNLLDRRRNALV